MFLKKNRYGKIKGITCEYGRKQRGKFTTDEAASLTTVLESVLLT